MSLGFYSIIFFIVALPGLIVRRFYYTQEFSKQFSSKKIVVSILYSVILGLIIVYLTGVLYNSFLIHIFNWGKITPNKIQEVYNTCLGRKPITLVTYLFNGSFLFKIVVFGLATGLMSIVIAYIAYNFVRRLGLDKKYSFLRFSNHWFYYLRGELFTFKILMIKKKIM